MPFEVVIARNKRLFKATIFDTEKPGMKFGEARVYCGPFKSLPFMHPLEPDDPYLPWHQVGLPEPEKLLFLEQFEVLLDPEDPGVGKGCGRQMLCELINAIKGFVGGLESSFVLAEAVPLATKTTKTRRSKCEKDLSTIPADVAIYEAQRDPSTMSHLRGLMVDEELSQYLNSSICKHRDEVALVNYYIRTFGFHLVHDENGAESGATLWASVHELTRQCAEAPKSCQLPFVRRDLRVSERGFEDDDGENHEADEDPWPQVGKRRSAPRKGSRGKTRSSRGGAKTTRGKAKSSRGKTQTTRGAAKGSRGKAKSASKSR